MRIIVKYSDKWCKHLYLDVEMETMPICGYIMAIIVIAYCFVDSISTCKTVVHHRYGLAWLMKLMMDLFMDILLVFVSCLLINGLRKNRPKFLWPMVCVLLFDMIYAIVIYIAFIQMTAGYVVFHFIGASSLIILTLTIMYFMGEDTEHHNVRAIERELRA